mgnify:FL=1
MGNCIYCGQSAGLFSHAHKECEQKHASGYSEFENICRRYFSGTATVYDVQASRKRLASTMYLNDADVAEIADKALRGYTDSIRRPFKPSHLKMVDDFINAVGVAYANVNSKGAVDAFTQKLLKGFMVEYFTDTLTLPEAQARCQRVISTLPISQQGANEAYYYVLNRAAHNFLNDGMLSDDEQKKIDRYVNTLALPLNNLPASLQGSEIEKLGQAAVLKNLQRGVLPQKSFSAPIMLGKSETILWAFNGVTVYEEKIEREWVGRNRGMSFRVCRGVYYRTGGSKGHAVEHASMQPIGTGTLYVTNKNLIFHSMMKGMKIPYKKIIGVNPYSDGIGIHRDGATAKRLTMQGFDPWFLMNAMSMIGD